MDLNQGGSSIERRTAAQQSAGREARVHRAVVWVNTAVAVGLFAGFLGIWLHWLLSGGDEASKGSISITGSTQGSAPRLAEKADLPSPVASEPSAEVSTAEQSERALNLNRRDRRRIQAGLRALGFEPGPADGLFGEGTRAAIRTWQASRGRPASGYLNAGEVRVLSALGDNMDGGIPAEEPQAARNRDRTVSRPPVRSGRSRDTRTGKPAKDGVRLDGGFRDDRLTGTDADDTINGRHGRDILKGAGGDDDLDGGFGDDTIYGDGGDDTIDGRGGDDFLDGGEGNDVIDGGFGDDTIQGGSGDDRINGSHGADTISGGTGDDTLRGGFGKDVFRFSEAHGIDRITDFKPRDDRIDVSDLPVDGFEDLSLKAVRRGVEIDLASAGGGTVFLRRVALGDLEVTNFVFRTINAGRSDMIPVEAEALFAASGTEGTRNEASRPALSIPVGAR